jgi:hypothetical protein
MSEPLLRNCSKTPAERREGLRQKFLNRRKWLDPAAQEIFDRTLRECYAETCEDDKTQTERRRQQLLDQKAACLQHMSPRAREYFERGIRPAARNGHYSATDPAGQPGFEANNMTAQSTKEILRKTRKVFDMAIARRDLTNANRALQNFIRIQQLERSAGDDMEGQVLYPPGVTPFPGAPGGRPQTEEEKNFQRELTSLSIANRMAIYEGFTATQRYLELGGDLADLVKDCYGGQRDR